ncbi:MAG: UDP-N-acetylmuramate--L-alanine ligase [Armatimonadota bacterium]|nr:UDP-N-acetylmuramate--L-alanine ligase [Armatimonadota bacterium]
MTPREARLHFVGIGGAGMSAIAEILLHRGYEVSGCDLRESKVLRRLRALGAQVWIGQSPDHLAHADVLVYSRAVGGQNDEIRAARERGLPLRHRAEMLGEIMRSGRGVAVVGTHGKTTTTAMLTRILTAAGLDPTALIGAEVPELGSNARAGSGPWVVAEVDESDGSLLRVAPWAAVLTSLDVTDHRDFYATAAQLAGTFEQFLQSVALEGFIVVCADHPGARALAEGLGRPVITYGFDPAAAVRAEMRAIEGHTTRASLMLGGRHAGELALQVPGRHNVSNATGAIAAALQIGVPVGTAVEALATFRGASRRFEVRGEADGVLVVDDYAHNPVKVAAVLRAAREGWPQHRVIALFQPHRFSRTITTHTEYAHAFDAADEVVITDIYAADERPQPGVTAQLIVDTVAAHRPVHYRATTEAALDLVEALALPGAIVLTLGAGDIWHAGDALLRRLAARTSRGVSAPAAESRSAGT